MPHRSLICLVLLLGLSSSPVAAQSSLANQLLSEGKTQEGIVVLKTHLEAYPNDAQAQFGLGAVRFITAVEHLGQNFYRYGLRDSEFRIPFLRLPVPANPKPETLRYSDLRQIFQTLIDELDLAEKALAAVNDPEVKLPIEITNIKLDFTTEGTNSTPLSAILGRMGVNLPEQLTVSFDQTDVVWLRGYCHLLSAISEFILAHDEKELFDATSHLFFSKPETSYPFLRGNLRAMEIGSGIDLADVVAFVHLIHFPVKEPARMKSSLHHLEQVLSLSEQMWQLAMAETDNDREWIPNAKQQSSIGQSVSQQMIDSWLLAMKEGTLVLQGKRLIPFWRGNGDLGINLRKVFTEPRTFDLVLWIQGTAATPYLEEGELTSPQVWFRLQQVFSGRFVSFAIWFN